MDSIEKRLISKSIEAFQMAIEIYNKPTIRYRVEGFALFVCNAWELMLKAHIINIGDSIYYKDNPDRTISLENCLKEIFTNDKDPLRKNLEKIIELRNTSTHFITEEYEMVYVPLFQACILNFNERMMEFHRVDMTEIIPQNFLTLSVSMKALNDNEIIAKYPEEIANRLLNKIDQINDEAVIENANYAIRIDHNHYLVKDPNKATSFVGISKDEDVKVKIIKDVKNPNETHKYNASKCIKKINKKLKNEEIELYYNNSPKNNFTQNDFTMFCKYFGIKQNEKLCFVYETFTTPQYTYSQLTIDFIVDELKKDPKNILNHLKKSI